MNHLLKFPALFILSLLLLNSCGNQGNAKSRAEIEESDKQPGEEVFMLSTQRAEVSHLQVELENAKKSGKAAFVVVTGNGVSDADKAKDIAKSANTIHSNSVVLEMNRDETANTELVNQWGLAGAPLPLILVISPKGYAVGGFLLQQATPRNLVELVPSPKMDDIYEALNNGNAAFLVVTKKSFSDREPVLKNCRLAVEKMKNKAVIVEMDISDPKEAKFFKQLNLKNTDNATSTIVINAQGQTTGMFEGSVETNDLVLAGYRVVNAGGCGPTCAPR